MSFRKFAATAVVATALGAGLAGGTTTAAAAQPAGALAADYLTTVIDQWTHYTPDWYTSSHAGTLYAGTSYFFCWTKGVRYSNNGHSSDIWLRTDDDTGHHNVYVSDVNLDTWGWNHDLDVLGHC